MKVFKEEYWNVTCSDGGGWGEDILASFTTEQAAQEYKNRLDSEAKDKWPRYVRKDYFEITLYESVGELLDSKKTKENLKKQIEELQKQYDSL